MSKRIRFCPRCMAIIGRKDTKCPSCGMEVSKMQEEAEKAEELKKTPEPTLAPETKAKETKEVVSSSSDGGLVVDTATAIEKEEEQQEREERLAEDAALRTPDKEIGTVVYEEPNQPAPKRHKHKSRQKEDKPEYTIDKNGEYNIDTSDVTYLDSSSYSAKKARGEYEPEKLKWWEIYKWADRKLAKRKIMKEVNKAARKTPVGIKRSTMIVLCILFGWMGAHSFYGRNYIRGTISLVGISIAMLVVNIPALYRIMGVFVGGGFGFVVVAMWLLDIIALIWGTYKYRISKLEFISNLNIETRAKIGRKYIHFDRHAFKAMEQKRMDKLNKKLEKKLKKQNEKQQKK